MDKGKINFLIDALMFLCMMAIAGIGFLMKYVLLPGRETWAVYGKKVEFSWLGWDRHDWGTVHLYLAFLLLGLLVLHIFLHWQMITGLFKKFFAEGKRRSIVAIVFVGLCVVLLFFPFFIQPDIDATPVGKGRGRSEIEASEAVRFYLARLAHYPAFAFQEQNSVGRA